MYWSGYDTLVLVTGVLTALLGALPVRGFPLTQRLAAVGIGVLLVVASFVTGNLASFTYPAIVMVGPAIPVIAAVAIIVRGVRERGAVGPTPDGSPAPVAAPRTAGLTDAQREALDPATDAARLAALAEHFPESREYVAAHPNAYPDLLAWLGSLGETRVTAALHRRAAGLAPLPPREPLINPFAGVPTAVFVRDGAAAALLIVAAFLPVQWYAPAVLAVLAIVAVVLALLGLVPAYLARATVLTPAAASVLRVALAAPVGLLALVVVLLDAAAAVTGSGAGGVGPAVALGLAGATLVALPHEPSGRSSRAGWIALAAAGGLVLLLGFVATITILLHGLFSVGSPAWLTYSLAALLVELVLVAGVIAFAALRRTRDGLLAVAVLGGAGMLGVLLVGSQSIPSLSYSGLTSTLLPAIGALAVVLLAASPRPAAWPVRSTLGLVLAGAAGAQAILSTVVFALGIAPVGVGVALVLLALALGALAFVVSATPVAERLVSPLARAIVGVVGLALAIAVVTVELTTGGAFTSLLALLLVVPVVLIGAEAPALVSDARAASARRAALAPAAPSSSASLFTAEQASDPATDPAVLQRIAAEAPHLRPLVAANPAAYEGLLEWLASLGDARVAAALRERGSVS